MCVSKGQAKCPLYRHLSMRKHLSVNSRVPWDTINLSMNPVLIVLEASLSSVNPVPIVWGQVRKHPCISADKFYICDLLSGPFLLVLLVSGNVCGGPLQSGGILKASGDICRNFPSLIGSEELRIFGMPQGYHRCV